MNDTTRISELEALLERSELRRRELQHRFAGTLQLIISMLHLQARQSSNESRRALTAASERVSTLAVIHGALLGDPDGLPIDLRAQLSELVKLHQQVAPANVQFSLTGAADGVASSPEFITSLLIVVNELLSNALQHAFPGGREGQVVVAIDGEGGANWAITVSDDGIGTLADNRAFGFGMRIATGLADHMHGQIEHLPAAVGTRVKVSFKAASPKASEPAS